ncbi:sugar ABC transporter ATP-binding protein [Vallitalea sediminicola]
MLEYILETKGIIKNFPGVRALEQVDLKIEKGEVHALVGENGAGKSTLMLTLGGIHKPDEGEILIEGERVHFDSAHDANSKGISVVYQELSLVPNLSVAENILANRQPVGKLKLIKKKELILKTKKMLKLFDIDYIDPMMLVKNLSIANQQVVEILKAISFNPKILILDEPTSSLTEIEVNRLFDNIRMLKKKGISFIYISHHLHEIFEIADSVTILRDGKYICNANVKDIDEDFLIRNMVGREIVNMYGERKEDPKIGDTIFEVKNISKKDTYHDINFLVKQGEIVGFAGLVGAGRTEIGRGIFGAEPIDSGEIYLEGKKLRIKSPSDAIKHKISYLTEDRKTQGLYLDFSIKSNFISNKLDDFTSGIFIKDNKVNRSVEGYIKEFGVVTPNADRNVSNLSGGNQQKVLLGMWFGIHPKVLIVDEPTRGVDVGAKSEIYELLRELASKGTAVIVISSDLPEVLGISDRIIVMKEGHIVGELSKEEADEENVIALATGVDK